MGRNLRQGLSNRLSSRGARPLSQEEGIGAIGIPRAIEGAKEEDCQGKCSILAERLGVEEYRNKRLETYPRATSKRYNWQRLLYAIRRSLSWMNPSVDWICECPHPKGDHSGIDPGGQAIDLLQPSDELCGGVLSEIALIDKGKIVLTGIWERLREDGGRIG